MRRYLDQYTPNLYFYARRIAHALLPARLPRKGANCRIHPSAMFEGDIGGICLGDRVNIDAYAQVYAARNSNIKIGNRCTLAAYSIVKAAAKGAVIEIGDHSTLQSFSIIYGAGPVRIGNYVRIASHTSIIPANKSFSDIHAPIHSQPNSERGITIEDDVWIASGVRILDGVTIGRGSVVAAGAVVTSSFPPLSVIGGVPARLMRMRGADDELAAGVNEQAGPGRHEAFDRI